MLNELKAFIEKHSAPMNENDTQSPNPNLFSKMNHFFHQNQKDILKYASRLESPPKNSETQYNRHLLLKGPNYSAYIHAFKASSSTAIHNHGSSNCYLIPLTADFWMVNYHYENLNINKANIIETLYDSPAQRLIPHECMLHDEGTELVHRVYTAGKEAQKALEVYLPYRNHCGIYLPIYGKQNKYLYIIVDEINVNFYLNTLRHCTYNFHSGICEKLVAMDNNKEILWPIFLEKNSVITDFEGVEAYLRTHSNSNAYFDKNTHKLALH